MKTTVTLTKHYPPNGKGPNSFLTEDGQRFKAWPDNPVSSQLMGYLNVPIELEYDVVESGQYVNNMVKSFTPLGDVAPQTQPASGGNVPEPTVKPVDRNAGLARAIEYFGVTGDSLEEAFATGDLFELADVFAEYGALGVKPATSSSVAVGA